MLIFNHINAISSAQLQDSFMYAVLDVSRRLLLIGDNSLQVDISANRQHNLISPLAEL